MSDMSGQSAAGGYRPAGWYYAQGDPPGTQRYWDGSAWQGDPQPVNPAQYAPSDQYRSPEQYGSSGEYGSSDQYSASSQYGSAQQSTGQGGTGYDHEASSTMAETASTHDQATPTGDEWGPPPADVPPSSGSSGSGDLNGFLSTLFDTKFTSFITGRAISVVYILVLIAVGLLTLLFVVGGLAGGGARALVALILGPLIGLFYLVMIRMTLEFFVNQFRQTELLQAIAEKLDRTAD